MEKIEGTPLDQLTEDILIQKPELLPELVRIIAVMHNNNLIHGDLKSENIILDKKGVWKILDFEDAIAYGGGREDISGDLLKDQLSDLRRISSRRVGSPLSTNTRNIFYQNYLINRNFKEAASVLIRQKRPEGLFHLLSLMSVMVEGITRPSRQVNDYLSTLVSQIDNDLRKYPSGYKQSIFEKFKTKVEDLTKQEIGDGKEKSTKQKLPPKDEKEVESDGKITKKDVLQVTWEDIEIIKGKLFSGLLPAACEEVEVNPKNVIEESVTVNMIDEGVGVKYRVYLLDIHEMDSVIPGYLTAIISDTHTFDEHFRMGTILHKFFPDNIPKQIACSGNVLIEQNIGGCGLAYAAKSGIDVNKVHENLAELVARVRQKTGFTYHYDKHNIMARYDATIVLTDFDSESSERTLERWSEYVFIKHYCENYENEGCSTDLFFKGLRRGMLEEGTPKGYLSFLEHAHKDAPVDSTVRSLIEEEIQKVKSTEQESFSVDGDIVPSKQDLGDVNPEHATLYHDPEANLEHAQLIHALGKVINPSGEDLTVFYPGIEIDILDTLFSTDFTTLVAVDLEDYVEGEGMGIRGELKRIGVKDVEIKKFVDADHLKYEIRFTWGNKERVIHYYAGDALKLWPEELDEGFDVYINKNNMFERSNRNIEGILDYHKKVYTNLGEGGFAVIGSTVGYETGPLDYLDFNTLTEIGLGDFAETQYHAWPNSTARLYRVTSGYDDITLRLLETDTQIHYALHPPYRGGPISLDERIEKDILPQYRKLRELYDGLPDSLKPPVKKRIEDLLHDEYPEAYEQVFGESKHPSDTSSEDKPKIEKGIQKAGSTEQETSLGVEETRLKLAEFVVEYKSKAEYEEERGGVMIRSKDAYESKSVDVVHIDDEEYSLIREKLWDGSHSLKLVNKNTQEKYEFLVEVPIGEWSTSRIEEKFEIQKIAHECGRALRPLYADLRKLEDAGTGKIVMEMIEVESLHDIMDGSRWRDTGKTIPGLKFQRKFGEALNDIHKKGIIHNDLGLLDVGDGRNIMLTGEEEIIFVNYGDSELLREGDQDYIRGQINELSKLTGDWEYKRVYRAYMESGGLERIGDYLRKNPDQADEVCELLPGGYGKKLSKGIELGTTSTKPESDPEIIKNSISSEMKSRILKGACFLNSEIKEVKEIRKRIIDSESGRYKAGDLKDVILLPGDEIVLLILKTGDRIWISRERLNREFPDNPFPIHDGIVQAKSYGSDEKPPRGYDLTPKGETLEGERILKEYGLSREG
ncbi:MAG: hypothetical protein U9Q22_03300, partial [Candidatus Altiarchaeota archaeon]|nr:hypothetical protein [Candidatus Altiarchaeota archaeon]